MPRSPAAAACLMLITFTVPVVALAGDEFWDYKQWRSFAETAEGGQRQCLAMTGGDGDDRLNVETTPAGGFEVYFDEQTYRGMVPNLQARDRLVFELDTTPPTRATHVTTTLGYDEDGIPTARATVAGAEATALIGAMRAASTLTVTRANATPERPPLVAEFSLAGFTANYLKASEWCGLQPVAASTPP